LKEAMKKEDTLSSEIMHPIRKVWKQIFKNNLDVLNLFHFHVI